MSKEYPYIGKHPYTAVVVFFHKPKEGVVLEEGRGRYSVGDYCNYWIQDGFQDVTEQYLQNKNIPIESPEHSEYIQRMAFRYGFYWDSPDDRGSTLFISEPWIGFWKDKQITYGFCSSKDFAQLHLPLPPANTQTTTLSEGTTVLANSNIGTIKLPKDNNNNYVVLLDSDVYTLIHERDIKELTQEDIHQHKIKSRLEEILLPHVDDISVCDDIMNEFTLEEK